MHTSKFTLYGATIGLKTNSLKISNEIHNDLKDYKLKNDECKSDCEVEIFESSEKFPIKIPKFAIRETYTPPYKETYISSDFRFFKEKNNYIIKVDLRGVRIVGYFKPSNKSIQFSRFLMKWVLIKALENKDVFFIHGSGVSDDEMVSLFIGPSGFGKTSMLISLLQKGYKMISDDTIFVKNGYVLPFYIRSMIHNDTLKKFPVLKKCLRDEAPFIPRQGWLIDLGEVFQVEKEKIKPTNLFFIYVWNSRESKIEKVPKKEMLSRLLYCYTEEYKNSIWFKINDNEIMRKNFQTCASLIENVNCYKIFAGRNLSEFFSKIRELKVGHR